MLKVALGLAFAAIDACTYVRHYRDRYDPYYFGQHDDDHDGQGASAGVAQVNVNVVRSRRLSTVVIVAPASYRD